LRSHEIDVFYDVPAIQVDQLRGIEGISVASTSTLHWEHIAFNTRRPPLDDVRVRRALCYALDEAALHTKVYRGLGTVGPVEFNPDFEWADKKIVPYPYDSAKAEALLESAGWKRAADGIRYREGRPLAVTISTVAGVKNREQIEVLLQNWWRAVGVDASVKNFPAATLFAPAGAGGMLYGGKTDVSLFTWENATPDPDDQTFIGPRSLPPVGPERDVLRQSGDRTAREGGHRDLRSGAPPPGLRQHTAYLNTTSARICVGLAPRGRCIQLGFARRRTGAGRFGPLERRVLDIRPRCR
jgi:ABC-type transport system substrate-binding protein